MYKPTLALSRVTIVVFAVFLSLAANVNSMAAQAPHSHTAMSDSATVRGVIVSLFGAAESGDLAALDSIYAGEDLTVIEGAGINRGWKDYRDHHLAPELKEMSGFEYRPFEIQARTNGSLAWAIFRYTLKGKIGDRVIDNVGRGTAILERRGGRWVVRHTQTSSRARRPTDSTPSQ